MVFRTRRVARLAGRLTGERTGEQLRVSAAAWLALRDLSVHRRQVVALGIVFAIAVAAFVALGSYRQALCETTDQRAMVPRDSGDSVLWEFYGSRLSRHAALLGARTSRPAEVHSIVGASLNVPCC
jgi:hypothetical protein